MTLQGRPAQSWVKTPAALTPRADDGGMVLPADAVGPDFRRARKVLDAKLRVHRQLIEELNLTAIDKVSKNELRGVVATMVSHYVLEERLPVNAGERERLIDEVIDELTGLGPIEPLLKDPTIDDIVINTHKNVYVERAGVLERLPVFFRDEAHLLRIVNKMVAAVGRRIDELQPMADARLPDGSRVHAVVRPVAVDGPLVSIRKFTRKGYSLAWLVETGSLAPPVAALLAAAVRGRLSVLISGGAGSGKTTMLNALSRYISHKERLITIEDTAELRLQQPLVGRLETRPPNIEGIGEIRQHELVKNALRMRPDRIIVGEVRGEEALDMLHAMNTGQDGSMTTIHANSTGDALIRIEQMVAMAGYRMSQQSIRAAIASAIRIIVHLQRFSDGTRRVTQVSEITGMKGHLIEMQTLFQFARLGTDANGTVRGELRSTGVKPKFLETLRVSGIEVSTDGFVPKKG